MKLRWVTKINQTGINRGQGPLICVKGCLWYKEVVYPNHRTNNTEPIRSKLQNPNLKLLLSWRQNVGSRRAGRNLKMLVVCYVVTDRTGAEHSISKNKLSISF